MISARENLIVWFCTHKYFVTVKHLIWYFASQLLIILVAISIIIQMMDKLVRIWAQYGSAVLLTADKGILMAMIDYVICHIRAK